MNKRDLKHIQILQGIVNSEVGKDCKWSRIIHLHEYLLKIKNAGEKTFRMIPIDFRIKFTKPLQPERARKKKPAPLPVIPFEGYYYLGKTKEQKGEVEKNG